MCGRFAFFQSPAEARRQLRELGDPVDEIWGEENVRQSYNFAPGYTGLVYRAAATSVGTASQNENEQSSETTNAAMSSANDAGSGSQKFSFGEIATSDQPKYLLQAMKWGLVPFWTKQKPQYGSLMRTINCRDDSLIEDRGMWTSMKRRKRCMVLCNGFYEWLKKNNGKERIPHYIRRKDNKMMCLAGLWDCVKYEGEKEELYTFTIITTDSNQQLKFLHDRMPVILEQNSDAMQIWLNPSRIDWNDDLQSLLKPFGGDLDVYPVRKEVGKVGNNSPDFIIPLDSSENKSNIANLFAAQRKTVKNDEAEKGISLGEDDLKKNKPIMSTKLDSRATVPATTTEHNAPMPVSQSILADPHERKAGMKHKLEDADQTEKTVKSPRKHGAIKSELQTDDDNTDRPLDSKLSNSPIRSQSTNKSVSARQSNHKHNNEGTKNTRITSFFGSV